MNYNANQNYYNYMNNFNMQKKQISNNIANQQVTQNMSQNKLNSKNNMNFNLPLYEKNASPSDLFNPYDGFIRGNMFPDLYNQYKISSPYNVEPMNEQAQALTYLDSLGFAAYDLNLYLDNFPNDRDMIMLFNQYQKEVKKAKDEYESKYGPLCANSDASNTYPWAWNESPWPWEN